ncbi:hypothetical protein [Streptomyces sp. NPDC047042]|uniref:hypothetical protein n=1 Tax=Streptomyces sp. NPDC047042 TaxID=3154807 RepID=UPI0033D9DD8F
MTGPEHYLRAQHLLTTVTSESGRVRGESGDDVVIAVAQVHATLALAAASAEQASVTAFAHDINSTAIDEWAEALGSTGGR